MFKCLDCGKRVRATYVLRQIETDGDVECPKCGSTDIDVDEK